MEELGRADSALRGIVSVSSGLVGKSILFHGTEEQKQEWLPQLAAATKLGCFGLTEPGTGSDAGNLTSRATRDGSRLGDQRAEALHHQRHLGRRGAGLRPHQRRRPARRDGVPRPDRLPRLRGARDHAASSGCAARRPPSCSSTTYASRTPPALGEVGQGFKIAMGTLDKGRLAVASGCVGIVQGCLEASVAYATQRTQFGKPIASFQLVQDLIADISLDADAARLLGVALRRPDRPR